MMSNPYFFTVLFKCSSVICTEKGIFLKKKKGPADQKINQWLSANTGGCVSSDSYQVLDSWMMRPDLIKHHFSLFLFFPFLFE